MNNIISKISTVGTLLILLVALSSCGGAEERKIKYLDRGISYLDDKNYDKAKIEFKNVMQIDPKFAKAYYYMAQLNERTNDIAKALGNYKQAIDLDPSYTQAKIKLSRIYVLAGTDEFIKKAEHLISEVKQTADYSIEADLVSATIKYKAGNKAQAIRDLKDIVDKDPEQVEAISLLATIYLAEGHEDKVKSILVKGSKDNPENIALKVSLAKLLSKNSEFSEAERYLLQAVEIEPEGFALQVALSSLYSVSGQLDKAEDVLRKLVKQDPDDARRYLLLVNMLSSKISVKAAEDELNKSIRIKPDLYELKFSKVKFLEKILKREEAKQLLAAIIEDRNYDVEAVKARTELARLLLDEANQVEAKKHVDAVLKEHPTNNEALLINSKISLANIDAVSAINDLRIIIKNQPKNTEATLLLANAYVINDQHSLAEQELQKSIEINPVNDMAHANYSRFLMSQGRKEDAINVVDKALTYFKGSYDLMDIKLKLIASEGDSDKILSLLDMMEQASPTNSEVNINKGKYYLSQKDIDNALVNFEKAYTNAVQKYKPLELIIKTYLYNKNPEMALKRLQSILDVEPDNAIATHLKGQVYLVEGDTNEARNMFAIASKNMPGWFPPYTSLAGLYVKEGNIDKAIAVYSEAIDKLSNKIPAYLQIASLHEKKKDYNSALNVYKSILETNSKNKLAANNYAALLLDHGNKEDMTEALKISRSFEKINQPALQDTLGWAYAKTGDNNKAIEVLKPLVDKSPKIAVFRYHLGYSLYQLGEKDAAKSHLELAVSSDQDFVGKDQAEELLKNI